MSGCTVPRCHNSYKKGFKLYRYPLNPERRKIWLQNVNRPNWNPTRHSVICEVHFEPSMFESHRMDGWRKLKPNAIPTIFKIFDNTQTQDSVLAALDIFDYKHTPNIIPDAVPTGLEIFVNSQPPKIVTSVSKNYCTASDASTENTYSDMGNIVNIDENIQLRKKMEEIERCLRVENIKLKNKMKKQEECLRNANLIIKEKIGEISKLKEEVIRLQRHLMVITGTYFAIQSRLLHADSF